MTSHSQGTVFLVDDEEAVRKGLGRLLRSVGYAVQSFGSADEFQKSEWSRATPSCLLLDECLPGLSGRELHRQLRDAGAVLPVVYITGHSDVSMGVEAMKAGAVDFLPKPVHEDQLLPAVETALTEAKRQLTARQETESLRQAVATLTARELQVLRLVARGWLNKQIAGELGIVEQTVKVHRARLMHKMRARSVADLVRAAERLGLAADTPPYN